MRHKPRSHLPLHLHLHLLLLLLSTHLPLLTTHPTNTTTPPKPLPKRASPTFEAYITAGLAHIQTLDPSAQILDIATIVEPIYPLPSEPSTYLDIRQIDITYRTTTPPSSSSPQSHQPPHQQQHQTHSYEYNIISAYAYEPWPSVPPPIPLQISHPPQPLPHPLDWSRLKPHLSLLSAISTLANVLNPASVHAFYIGARPDTGITKDLPMDIYWRFDQAGALDGPDHVFVGVFERELWEWWGQGEFAGDGGSWGGFGSALANPGQTPANLRMRVGEQKWRGPMVFGGRGARAFEWGVLGR